MDQNINLFTKLPDEYRHRITIEFVLRVLSIVAGVLLFVFVIHKTQVSFATGKVEDLTKEKRTQQNKISQYKRDNPKIQKNTALQNARDQLDKNLKRHVALAEDLARPEVSNTKGLSIYFRGLAESMVSSLWLKEINIQKGGLEITLNGVTKDVGAVRQFVKNLSDLELFDDYELKIKRLETSLKHPGKDDFVIIITSQAVLEDPLKKKKRLRAFRKSG